MRKITSSAIDNYLEDLKANNLFVLYGEERFFSDEVVKKIESKVFKDKAEKDLNYHQYSGLENNISEVLASCLSFPMLSSHKMVVLKDFDKIKQIPTLRQ